ncbi:hypothetical protein, partial [Solimonas sp. SE-A11]|uniref:hypothetical protein n=1 Tax=Solimonas sp. SE-A11 TaxID=3054954 RepID=UPI00259D0DB1
TQESTRRAGARRLRQAACCKGYYHQPRALNQTATQGGVTSLALVIHPELQPSSSWVRLLIIGASAVLVLGGEYAYQVDT